MAGKVARFGDHDLVVAGRVDHLDIAGDGRQCIWDDRQAEIVFKESDFMGASIGSLGSEAVREMALVRCEDVEGEASAVAKSRQDL